MAVVGVGVAQVGVGESQKKRIERHHFGVPKRKSGILLMVRIKRKIVRIKRKDCQSDKEGGGNPNTSAPSIQSPLQTPIDQGNKRFVTQGIMNSGKQGVKDS